MRALERLRVIQGNQNRTVEVGDVVVVYEEKKMGVVESLVKGIANTIVMLEVFKSEYTLFL